MGRPGHRPCPALSGPVRPRPALSGPAADW